MLLLTYLLISLPYIVDAASEINSTVRGWVFNSTHKLIHPLKVWFW